MSLPRAGPRLWLGRPCYFEFRDAPGCAPLMWTHRRYAPEVVTSMVAALREFLTEHPFRNVVLVALTGWGQESDRRRAHDAGFDHHIDKPASIAELRPLLLSLRRDTAATSS